MGGGGSQSSDDAMNQLVVNTIQTWIVDTLNQQRQMEAAGNQTTALWGQNAEQQNAVSQAQQVQNEQRAREDEYRRREEGLMQRMNDMSQEFSSRMAAFSDYQSQQAQAEADRQAQLAEQAKKDQILADQKKQDELRNMRARLWAGGYEGTKLTGGQGDLTDPTSTAGKALGNPGQVKGGGIWSDKTTPVRGGSGQGLLGLVVPPGWEADKWLPVAGWTDTKNAPPTSWVMDRFRESVLGTGG